MGGWTYSKRRLDGEDDGRVVRIRLIRLIRSFPALLGADPGCHAGVGKSFEVVGKPSGYVQAGGARPEMTATTRASTSRSGNALLRCTQIRRAV